MSDAGRLSERGGAFHRRCPYATELCARERPELKPLQDHLVACHHAGQISEDRDQVSEGAPSDT